MAESAAAEPMRAGDAGCDDEATQEATQIQQMTAGSGLMPGFSGGQMSGAQGTAQWMHPGTAVAGWEMPRGWDTAFASGYAMPYAMPPQQLMMAPHVQTRGAIIFLCDPQTEEECLQRGLFGMPASQTQLARNIAPEETLLLLFNVRRRTRTRSVCAPARAPAATAGCDAWRLGGPSLSPSLALFSRVRPSEWNRCCVGMPSFPPSSIG